MYEQKKEIGQPISSTYKQKTTCYAGIAANTYRKNHLSAAIRLCKVCRYEAVDKNKGEMNLLFCYNS